MSIKARIDKYFILFLYISIVFLVIGLFRYDYVEIDIDRFDYKYLVLSFLCLFIGFLINALCWYLICRQSIKAVSLSAAISSHGLSIFGKYIPGKIWTILGRATYLSRLGVSLTATTQLSFYTQLLSIWAGLSLGIIGLAFISSLSNYLWIVVLWILISIGLFAPLHKSNLIDNLINKVTKNKISLDWINFIDIVKKLPAFFLFWLCWTWAFFFLLKSLFPNIQFVLYASLAFPFAATVGIVAFIFPGGLGVRESFLVLYLINCGMSMENAALTSIVARIWFIIGEFFIFIVAIFLKMQFLEKSK